MFKFLFGKKSDEEEKEINSVFRTGYIVQDDASRYDPPQIDENLIESVPMVPTQLAENSLKEISEELIQQKSKYDSHVSSLKIFNSTTMKSMQVFYENELQTLKSKALKHAEVQTKIRLLLEDKLNREINDKQNEIEDLLDKLSQVKEDYQDQKRVLQADFQANLANKLKEQADLFHNQTDMEHKEFEERMNAIMNDNEKKSEHEHELEAKIAELKERERLENLAKAEIEKEKVRESEDRDITITQVNNSDMNNNNDSDTATTAASLDAAHSRIRELEDEVKELLATKANSNGSVDINNAHDEMNKSMDGNITTSTTPTPALDHANQEELADSIDTKTDTNVDVNLNVLQGELAMKDDEINQLKAQIGLLQKNSDSSSNNNISDVKIDASNTVTPDTPDVGEVISTDSNMMVEIQTLRTEVHNLRAEKEERQAAAAAVLNNADNDEGGGDTTAVITVLEDHIIDLKAENSNLEGTIKGLELKEKNLQIAYDELKAAKRTDVVARMETEIELLKEQVSTLNFSHAEDKATTSKDKQKLKELQERANRAELELRQRDKLDKKEIDPKSKEAQQASQITKQRDELISKTAAETAGWNAAAETDEKFDKEVQLAYERGLEESKKQYQLDIKGLNSGMEEKEKKLTEVLDRLKISEEEGSLVKLALANATKEIEELNANLLDTMMVDDVEGATGVEVAQLRVGLDQAQEEVVEWMEKNDSLQEQLDIADNRIGLMTSMIKDMEIEIEKLKTQAALAATTARSSGGRSGDHGRSRQPMDIMEIKQTATTTIKQGTDLWKQKKRNECFDLYLKTCKKFSSSIGLQTEELRGPIVEAVNAAISASNAPAKARAAVALRKALDHLIAVIDEPDVQEAERTAAEERTQASSTIAGSSIGGNTDISHAPTSELAQKMAEMKEKLGELATEQNNAASIMNIGTSNQEGSDDNDHQKDTHGKTEISSILKRAQTAENQVQLLKQALLDAQKQQQVTVPTTTDSKSDNTTAAGRPQPSAVDAAEMRKMKRKIKELEIKLARNEAGPRPSGGTGGGGSSAAADAAAKKAAAQTEKKLNKQIKEQENTFKKEKNVLEKKLKDIQRALDNEVATSASNKEEIDDLRAKAKQVASLSKEVEDLRKVAGEAAELTKQVETMTTELKTVSDQCKKESTLRKKYKNELEDLKGAIRVYARMRPFAQYELERRCEKVVDMHDETTMSVNGSRGKKEFEFDAVFDDNSTQDQVFEDTKRLVESCLDGYNVCLFAYGQTGSGKTFTMTGSDSMPGLTPKAINELFSLIGAKKTCKIKVSCYFLELYNDNLVDLFFVLDQKKLKGKDKADKPPKLEIKLNAKKIVEIPGCVIKEASSPDELMTLFHTGNKERHTGATKMNAESSRSHSIFAILIESYDKTTKRTTYGKLSLVDLAGSERADKTGATAERLKEGMAINKSLSALGDVMAALSEGEKFIPYRNNKLTQVMQDSLGGNAKTLMFVNISPADYNADETTNSLQFATRVKKVTNQANKTNENEEVVKLKHIIKKLQAGQQLGDDEAAIV